MSRLLLSLLAPALLAVTLGSCSSGGPERLSTVDIIGNIDHADFGDIDSLFEIEAMIHPELTDSTMLTFPFIRGELDGCVYLQQENRLMVFDLATGRCVSSFDHTGQGPEDYLLLRTAWPSAADGGSWTALDIRADKVVRYSAEGRFIGSWTVAPLSDLVPCGSGWMGIRREDGFSGRKRLYFYSTDMALTDSLVTHFPLTPYRGVTVFPDGSAAAMVESDTIFTVTPESGLNPVLAFDTGSLRMPVFDNFDEAMAHMRDYLMFEALLADGFVLVGYNREGSFTCQIFGRPDCRLLYSYTAGSDDGIGLPFTVGGRSYNLLPVATRGGNSFFGFIPGFQIGDDDSNVAIVKLRFRSPS